MNYNLNILTDSNKRIVNLSLYDHDTGTTYCGSEIIKNQSMKSKLYNNYDSTKLSDNLMFFSFKLNNPSKISQILNLNFKEIHNQDLGYALSLMKIEEIVIWNHIFTLVLTIEMKLLPQF